MHLHAFLAAVALGGSIWLLLRHAHRTFAIAAAVLSAAELLMALGYLSIHVSHHLPAIGWVAIGVLAVLLYLKQSTRTGGAICGAMLAVAAIPVLSWVGVLR